MFGKFAQFFVTEACCTVKLSPQFDDPMHIGWDPLFRTIMLCATSAWSS